MPRSCRSFWFADGRVVRSVIAAGIGVGALPAGGQATIGVTGGGVNVFTNGSSGRLGSNSGLQTDDPSEISGTSGTVAAYAGITAGPVGPGELPTLPGTTGVVRASAVGRIRYTGDGQAMRIDASGLFATAMENLDGGSHVASSQGTLHYEFTIDVPTPYAFSGRLAVDDQDTTGSVRLVGPSAFHFVFGQPHRDFSFSGVLNPGVYEFDASASIASNGAESGNMGGFSEQSYFSAVLRLGQPCDPNDEPQIVVEPPDVTACPDGAAAFSLEAAGAEPISYEWQIELPPPMLPDTWVALDEQVLYLPCGATATATPADSAAPVIMVDPCDGVSAYRIRCLVASPCGGLPSREAMLNICTGCVADVDCDCDVDLDDLLIVLGNFGVSGATSAQGDLDGDADVDLDDLLLVLGGFGVPC